MTACVFLDRPSVLCVYVCVILLLKRTHKLSPLPASRRMLWITLHLRLVRSQERTALDRIRQQSESTLSHSLIISSVCLSDLFSSLFVHCLGLSFPHLLRSFFLRLVGPVHSLHWHLVPVWFFCIFVCSDPFPYFIFSVSISTSHLLLTSLIFSLSEYFI